MLLEFLLSARDRPTGFRSRCGIDPTLDDEVGAGFAVRIEIDGESLFGTPFLVGLGDAGPSFGRVRRVVRAALLPDDSEGKDGFLAPREVERLPIRRNVLVRSEEPVSQSTQALVDEENASGKQALDLRP